MLRTAGFIVAVAYLPGAVIFRLPIADRAKRASLAAEERLFWALTISVIVSTTGAFALASIGAYTLERLVMVNVGVAIVAALTAAGRLRLGPTAPAPGWTAILPAGLVALGVWMYFAVPASEYVLGGRDPGVYMSEGVQIAQRRSLVTIDPMAAAVPDSSRDLFFPSYGAEGYYSVRFMGFHLRDPRTGTVSGQFPQGYPVWIAIAYGIDGLTGTRRVIAWWAILGVVAVYFAARRLIGPVPAAAAAALLCVHVIQTWYARYPNSEIVTQALLFGALLAHAYAHEEDDRFFGPVAASLLGLALFTRMPVVLAVGTAVAASLLAPAGGHRTRFGFLATLAGWLAAAGIYYATQLRPYAGRPIAYLYSLEPVHFAALAAAFAAGCALMWAIRRPRAAELTKTWLPRALIAAVTIGTVYALFFREPATRLAPHDAYAMRVFTDLYFSRIALALAVIGYALLVSRSFWRAPALLLTVTALSGFFFYKMRIWPEHFWLARRFLTEILPGALVFASAALFAPAWMGSELRIRAGIRAWLAPVAVTIGVVATLLVGYGYLSASRSIRTHIEYAGLIPKLEHLAAMFGDDELVLFEAREASDVHALGLPLSYIYARNVLVLHDARPDNAAFREFLAWASERYKSVYLVAGGGTDLPGIGSAVVATERFHVPEYEKTTYDDYPRKAVMKPFDFTIYRLLRTESTAPQSLDIGGTDDLNLVAFHPKERLGGGDLTFRWTQDTSYLIMRVDSGSRELALRLSAGRPRGVPPPQVTVHVGGLEIGSVQPTNEFREYVFPIPPGVASSLTTAGAGSQIEIHSSTWVPQSTTGGSDTRALGVMIDTAEIR